MRSGDRWTEIKGRHTTHHDADPDGRVGKYVHQVLGAVAGTSQTLDEPQFYEVALAATRTVLGAALVPAKDRGTFLSVLNPVLCFRTYFLPDDRWAFVGAEVPLGADGIVDLVWSDAFGRVLIDEVKTGIAERRGGPGRTRDQVARYVAAGALAYPRFVGVRLIKLAAPMHSMLAAADGGLWRLVRLVDTDYWFERRDPYIEVIDLRPGSATRVPAPARDGEGGHSHRRPER